MAVSLELSMVQRNTAQSAIINAQTEEFLRLGGHISFSPPMKPVPRPYGRQKPVDPSTRLLRSTQKVRRGKALRTHSVELIDQIEAMAKTMSCPEVAAELSMTYDQVKCIGTRHAIIFQKAENAGHKSLVHNTIDEALDKKDAERIRAAMQLGITLKQAIKHLQIGSTRFYRLLEAYEIDYPRVARMVGRCPE